MEKHVFCDHVKNVSSILNGKIKFVHEDICLPPMKKVSEQFMIMLDKVNYMKYAVNSSCFHARIEMRTDSNCLRK